MFMFIIWSCSCGDFMASHLSCMALHGIGIDWAEGSVYPVLRILGSGSGTCTYFVYDWISRIGNIVNGQVIMSLLGSMVPCMVDMILTFHPMLC